LQSVSDASSLLRALFCAAKIAFAICQQQCIFHTREIAAPAISEKAVEKGKFDRQIASNPLVPACARVAGHGSRAGRIGAQVPQFGALASTVARFPCACACCRALKFMFESALSLTIC
jgi:hypothetical protein